MIDKNSKYCLFFDWDGTLRVSSSVSDENKAALEAVKAAGHYIILNTGRSRANIPQTALDLTEWDGIIAGMSYAEFHGKVIMKECMPKETLLHVCRFAETTNTECAVQGINNLYIIGDSDDPDIITVADFRKMIEEDYDSLCITNIALNGNIKTMPLNEFYGCWSIFHEEGGYSEIMLNGYNKSTGIKMISEALGIPREHTVSFGDSVNDIDMLKYTGIAVIMKSAVDELNGIAAMRTSDDRTGVAEAINKLFFN